MPKTVKDYEGDILNLQNKIDYYNNQLTHTKDAIQTCKTKLIQDKKDLEDLKKQKKVLTADLDNKLRNKAKESRMTTREITSSKRRVYEIEKMIESTLIGIKYRQRKIIELKKEIIIEADKKVEETTKQEVTVPTYLNHLGEIEIGEQLG